MNIDVLDSFSEWADEFKEEESTKGIAIIGVHTQIGSCKSAKDFFEALVNNRDLICDFPSKRWEDINAFYNRKYGKDLSDELAQEAYLNRIDLFDAEYFHISPTEAKLMSPLQRLFLESAFEAIEDAGYGGGRLKGTRTGVYLGYSKEGRQYEELAKEASEGFGGILVSGNVTSIIASRISYLLDLKGPAVITDTACSSSLVSLHLACRQMLDREIDMAIVGGIRLTMVPAEKDREHIGIESSSERTKTFDNSADGTGGGEGVISAVLKPVAQALEDGDNIYAVIKGSSINQDGASVGITAPNAAAQEDVIVNAWKDARIDPETISYIEAHGTATNLGDPVEIEGLKRAFSRYTNKNQFCSIGSVKTNIGHLDAAAGLAGLIKTVMMLKYKKIPPNLYFQVPNKKIDFISSPLTVSDTLREWNSDEPRRCGISSFGISGTNCHVVLEEAPPKVKRKKDLQMPYHILTMSALSKNQVMELCSKYQKYLKEHPNVDFANFCYTADTGRGHYTCRLAVIVKDKEEFINADLSADSFLEGWYYAQHKVTDLDGEPDSITAENQKKISRQADTLIHEISLALTDKTFVKEKMKNLLELYIKGADIDFNVLYPEQNYHRMSIPVYPFSRKRYWIQSDQKQKKQQVFVSERVLHPLVDMCIADSNGVKIYESKMSPDSRWILKEHRINGQYVLPGTAYLEMAHFVGQRIFKTDSFNLEDIIFMTPLICGDKDKRILHILASVRKDEAGIVIASRDETGSEWTSHVEMCLRKTSFQTVPSISDHTISEIQNRCEKIDNEVWNTKDGIVQLSGLRWNNTKEVWFNETEILGFMELDEILEQELEEYYLYPTLLDGAVNVGNVLANGFHLPFSYKKAVFYQPIPRKFYTYLKKTTIGREEIETFDITLYDLNKEAVGHIEEYVLKRVKRPKHFITEQKFGQNMYHEVAWVPMEEKNPVVTERSGKILIILGDTKEKDISFVTSVEKITRQKAIVVVSGKNQMDIPNMYQVIENKQEDYDKLLKEVLKESISDIIYVSNESHIKEDNLTDTTNIQAVFYLTKALLHGNIKKDIQITILTRYATEITGEEKEIIPTNHALAQMGSCIESEYDNLKIRVIDRDEMTTDAVIVQKIFEIGTSHLITAFRNNQSYVQKMVKVVTDQEQKDMVLLENGVYIIAGGFGGMGMTFARTLWESRPGIKILLLNRSYNDSDRDTLINRVSEKQSEFLNWASEKDIHLVKVDISDSEKMKNIFEWIHKEYGRIDGMIQAAGIEGNGFIYKKNWETFWEVLAPKVIGTWNLYQFTKEDNLQFFVLCSSIASLFGSAGQSDYTAANAYLDSFSYYLRRKGIVSIDVNWTGWSESGMAFRNHVNTETGLLEFLNDEEGAIVLEHILKLKKTRVLAGRIRKEVLVLEMNDLERRVDMSEIKQVDEEKQEETLGNENRDIVISGKSMEKLTATEKQIIKVWAETLGVVEVDVNKKFFETGGNSLLTATLHKGINKIYPGIMSITDIFVHSSVVEIAEYIDSKLTQNEQKTFETIEEDQNIDDLLEKFINGDISKDMIETLI